MRVPNCNTTLQPPNRQLQYIEPQQANPAITRNPGPLSADIFVATTAILICASELSTGNDPTPLYGVTTVIAKMLLPRPT